MSLSHVFVRFTKNASAQAILDCFPPHTSGALHGGCAGGCGEGAESSYVSAPPRANARTPLRPTTTRACVAERVALSVTRSSVAVPCLLYTAPPAA
jgi:hypothetical protein